MGTPENPKRHPENRGAIPTNQDHIQTTKNTMTSKLHLLISMLTLSIIAFATGCTKIDNNETGVIIKTFGTTDMPPGQIIALNGENGPQVDILGPGTHFYWFFTKHINCYPVMDIRPGFVGTIVALDGKPLPPSMNYAPEWPDLSYLNARIFLSGNGHKGPQLTVLPPGRYRYNPELFNIKEAPALTIEQGTVAVIRDNTGKAFKGEPELINGNPLVPKGFAGIWKEPLLPGLHYIHPTAYTPTKVKTTHRVFTYQKTEKYDDSILIRSKDGFQISISARVAIVIEPNNAPKLVALLGNPDLKVKSNQEDDNLEMVESQCVLPNVRTQIRNIGEKITALDMISLRSQKADELFNLLKPELEKNYLKAVAVYLDNADPSITDAGKALMETQTDKKIALEQIETFNQQQAAQETRQKLVNAETNANMEKNLVEAERSIEINRKTGEAQLVAAQYERQAYEEIIQALGQDNAAKIQIIKTAGDQNVKIIPDVYVSGNNTADNITGAILGSTRSQQTPQTK
jgi:regulator of protease activity HflC (stomatin/prohibitin superfamily)